MRLVVARARVVAAAAVVMLAVGCSSDDDRATPSPTDLADDATGAESATSTTGVLDERLTVHGAAQLDGSPLDADTMGAVVRDGGLVTACQVELPPVTDGQYEIAVYGEHEGYGCGRSGTEVILWTFTSGQRFFATTTLPWPADDNTATFDATFSTDTPSGPMPVATELAGEVFDAQGNKTEPGGRIEAFVGSTLCGVSTVREYDDFVGFSLSVVGPDAVPQCERNAPITFLVDGHRAVEMLNNDQSLHRSFDLTLS